MKKITPFLWFNGNAQEAAKFYVATFKDGKILSTSSFGPGKKAPVMSVTFRVHGQSFIAFNGGPHYTFSSATSFLVQCKTQQEIDRLWRKLSKGGEIMRCGWLKDRFGVTWQIVPEGLPKLLRNDNAMKAMMTMDKLDIKALKKAGAA